MSESKKTSYVSFEELKKQVEAILFVSETPLSLSEIRDWLGYDSLKEIRMCLRDLSRDYTSRSFEILEMYDHKYVLKLKTDYNELIKKHYAHKTRSLSKSALETLALIAYKQPITRAEINALRQVDSSSIIHALKERDFIQVAGIRKEIGNPLEYKTTDKFLKVFGLESLEKLPSLLSLQMNPEDHKYAKEIIKDRSEGLLEAKEEPLTEENMGMV
jgi:segregation and condensation protein B